MRAFLIASAIVTLALSLSGCVAYTVASTAVGVAGTAVGVAGTAVSVTGDIITAPFGGSDDDDKNN